MKTTNIFLLALVANFAFGSDVPSVQNSTTKLETVSGADRAPAQELLSAIRSHSDEKVRVKMRELVQRNKAELVAITLYDVSDNLKLEAARALASVKKKSIARALLDASQGLDLAVRGGTEDEGRRKRTKEAFADSLTAITGIAVNKDWNFEERTKALKEAIEKLPE